MSGMPNNTPLDVRKFRDAYLANLKLQAKNDDVNLQANKMFQRTGQVPTELTDYRLSSERLADLFKLRLDVQGELKTITDGLEAQSIVNQLDEDELVFLAQNIVPISEDIKKRFRYGIQSAIFLPYFRRYMAKFESNLGVEYGLTQESGDALRASFETLRDTLVSMDDITDLQNLLGSLSGYGRGVSNIVSNLEEIREVVSLIPKIENDIRDGRIQNADTLAMISTDVNNIVETLPTSDEIIDLGITLQNLVDRGDYQSEEIRTVLVRLQELTELNDETLQQVNVITDAIRQAEKDAQPLQELPLAEAVYSGDVEDINPDLGSIPQAKGTPKIKMFVNGYSSADAIRWVNDAKQYLDDSGVPEGQVEGGYSTVTTGTGATKWVVENNDLLSQYAKPMKTTNYGGKRYGDDFEPIQEEIELPKTPSSSAKKGRRERKATLTPPVTPSREEEDFPTTEGYGMKPFKMKRFGIRGCGVGTQLKVANGGIRKEQRGEIIKLDQIDFKKAVPQDKKFIPFGRFVINKNRLDKGVLAIKRPSGSVISQFPSQRISPKVQKILTNMIGGSLHSFEDYSELDDDERAYLHRLSEFSNIDSRLRLPAPKLNKNEEDTNRFEILKGQILAGNDNAQMVKEFKLLILKLSRNKLLPSGQTKDLLMTLAELGY